MWRFLAQILFIAEVMLCAADSPPISEETLKSKAFADGKEKQKKRISVITVAELIVCSTGVCRAFRSWRAVC